MDKTMNEHFQRVEKALAALISSIALYNPNVKFATDLVSADQGFMKGLEDLNIHQRNHDRLGALRNLSTGLDSQIYDTLTLLAETRKELIATPATTFSKNTNPVSYSELLSYARRISKTTRPTTFREEHHGENGIAESSQQVGQDIKLEAIKESPGHEADSNGVPPAGSANGTLTSTIPEASHTQPLDAGTSTALPAPISEWLNPNDNGTGFMPWPPEEKIRRGALASLQVLTDSGIDPATFDPEKSAELEAERKRREEEADKLREEQELERQRVDMERRAAAEQQGRTANVAENAHKVEEAPAVYTGLDLLDDDLDDDDD